MKQNKTKQYHGVETPFSSGLMDLQIIKLNATEQVESFRNHYCRKVRHYFLLILYS